MHLDAIDVDLWYVIKNGVSKTGEGVTPADVKKFIQLDSTAKNIICGHLTKGQYGRVSALETSKLVWDWLSKVNEGVSTQRDQRISTLRNLFNRFKRHDNENIHLTFDRLTDITNELHVPCQETMPSFMFLGDFLIYWDLKIEILIVSG